jgi:hypothetical protein
MKIEKQRELELKLWLPPSTAAAVAQEMVAAAAAGTEFVFLLDEF